MSARCELVQSDHQMRDVIIVRSLCFIGEKGISRDFIFDPNDYCASHFVFYIDAQPIGALRIRWFADFAKYERTCFIPAFRQPFFIKRCIHSTFRYVARKGYTRVLTQADPRLTELWIKLFDFSVLDDQPVLIEGHPPYLTVVGQIDRHADAVRFDGPGDLLMQAEGLWND